MQLTQTQQDTLSILRKAENILILPSSPMDGDSIGSALSLYLALQKLGKKITVVAEETPSTNYNFLPEISSISRELNFVRDFVVTIDCRDAMVKDQGIRHEIQGNKVNIIITPSKGLIGAENISFSSGKPPYDCIVTVDAADPSQFGKIYENSTELFHLAPVINIDHHASNVSFGKINLVDIMASSTTTLILPLIEELGAVTGKSLMDADIATLLLAGVITDTSSFQNPNTNPDAFALAAKLIGYGARQQEIIRNIYKTKKLSTLRLWGRTLSKIQYDDVHKLVWSVLTARDFAEIGSGPDETEGVIDELMSNAPNTEIIFLLKERSPTEVSGSIRTISSGIDASKLAGFFGGGGHVQAAGFKVHGKNIQQVETEVVAALKDFQKKRLRLPGAEPAQAAYVAQPPAPVPAQMPVSAPAPVETPAPVFTPPVAPSPPLFAPPAAAAPVPSAPTPPPVAPSPPLFTPPTAQTPTSAAPQKPAMQEFRLTQEFIKPVTMPTTPARPPEPFTPPSSASSNFPFPPQPGMIS